MSQAESYVYKKCITCGRYCPEGNLIVGLFCSEDCAVQYKRCPHCGNYFRLEDNEEKEFCSPECQNAEKPHIPGEDL